MNSVLLVVPPYHSLTSPALAISMLKAALSRLGIPADVLYLNLRFGSFVGRAVYDQVAQNARALAGDWLFAGDLFGDEAPDPGAYVTEILPKQLNLEPALASQVEAVRPTVPVQSELRRVGSAGVRQRSPGRGVQLRLPVHTREPRSPGLLLRLRLRGWA
jgi:hypothetical protein